MNPNAEAGTAIASRNHWAQPELDGLKPSSCSKARIKANDGELYRYPLTIPVPPVDEPERSR